MTTAESVEPVADRIDRQIHIDATADRVWELVARPGWWINDGTVVDLPTETQGDVVTVTHPSYGSFRIQTVRLDEPGYAAYRWLGGKTDAGDSEEPPTTLVEFWIEEQPTGGVLLRVAESGFAALPGGPATRREAFEDNDQGWVQELAAARAFLAPAGHA